MVDALAAGDAASVYGTVDRVVEAGHDPRRFATDLLDRFRDLIVLDAVPDAAERGLIDDAPDTLQRMSDQAARIGGATLVRNAEIVHTALIEMRGTTSPRLVLELLCARMQLPDAAADSAALLQRIERLERRNAVIAGDVVADRARAAAPSKAPAERGADASGRPPPAGRRRTKASRPAAAAPSRSPSRLRLRPTEARRRLSGRRRTSRHRRLAGRAPASRPPGRSTPPRCAGCGPRSSTSSSSPAGAPARCSTMRRSPRSTATADPQRADRTPRQDDRRRRQHRVAAQRSRARHRRHLAGGRRGRRRRARRRRAAQHRPVARPRPARRGRARPPRRRRSGHRPHASRPRPMPRRTRSACCSRRSARARLTTI